MLRHSSERPQVLKQMIKGEWLQLKYISKSLSISIEMIQKIVKQDNKSRYELAEIEEELWIRTSQGHSIENLVPDEGMFIAIQDPKEIPVCIHGTTDDAWKLIRITGLSRCDRIHIHFAKGMPGTFGVISGMRTSSKVIIYIDVIKAMSLRIVFLESKNKVILSAGIDGVIPVECFEKVLIWNQESDSFEVFVFNEETREFVSL